MSLQHLAISDLSIKFEKKFWLSSPNISKIFDSFSADIDFTNCGILFITGPNGIGKSILAKALSGSTDAIVKGHISVNNSKFQEISREAASNFRIEYIPQFLPNNMHITVGEILWSNIAGPRKEFFSYNHLHRELANRFPKYLSHISAQFIRNTLKQALSSINSLQKIVLFIISSCLRSPLLIILDEPFSRLSKEQSEDLIALIEYLNMEFEIKFLIISHPNQFWDQKKSTFLLTHSTLTDYENRSVKTLIHQKSGNQTTAPIINLAFRCTKTEPKTTLSKGDIICIHGQPSIKYSAFMKNMYQALADEYHERDCNVDNQHGSKIRIVPADANVSSIIPSLSVLENYMLEFWQNEKWTKYKFFVSREIAAIDAYETLVGKLKLQPENVHATMDNLSGGNRQKVVISRMLQGQPEALVLCDPFVGLDHASTQTLSEMLSQSANQGALVIVLAYTGAQDLFSERISIEFETISAFDIKGGKKYYA